jgi:hypothetical protein
VEIAAGRVRVDIYHQHATLICNPNLTNLTLITLLIIIDFIINSLNSRSYMFFFLNSNNVLATTYLLMAAGMIMGHDNWGIIMGHDNET